jgi:hypothetical protein
MPEGVELNNGGIGKTALRVKGGCIMKRYIVYGMLVTFLSVAFAGGIGLADDRTGAPSIDRIPLINIEPVQGQPSGDMTASTRKIETPTDAMAKEPDGGTWTLFDVMILRPAGVIACAMGLVASAVAMPFALPTGSQGKVAKTLVADPFMFTFARPVGQLP